MVLSMARPTKHPKSGVYRVRMVVPPPLRAIVGKRELTSSLRTKDPAEAKRLYPAEAERLDAILAAARAQTAGVLTTLTPREVAEIGGEVYREQAALAEAAPGSFEVRDVGVDLLRDELESQRPGALRYREARRILTERGIVPDAVTLDAVALAIVEGRLFAEALARRRAAGDWSADPAAARFPVPEPRVAASSPATNPAVSDDTPALTTTGLLEAFTRESPGQRRTHEKRTAAMRYLEAAAGHTDATRIGKAEVRAMKTARLAKVTAASVAADIAALRPVWRWAIDNGLLPENSTNPFANMTPRLPKTSEKARLPFTEDEAATILRAARTARRWERWVTWLLAMTGARLGEIADAAASDVRQEDGVWVLAVHPEAGGRSLKTEQSQRLVPLPDALIAEGFLDYVEKLPKAGPLFPDLPVGVGDLRAPVASKTLGRRLRDLGIKDPRKVAGYSWRHRMKDRLRQARVLPEAQDAFLGHDNATNAGSGYGVGWRAWPAETKAEVEKAALVPAGLDAPRRR